MVSPIYETTATNSHPTVDETHSPGTITGSIDRSRTGFAAEYIETNDMGKRGPTVKEFPSAISGTQFGGDSDVVNPMDTD